MLSFIKFMFGQYKAASSNKEYSGPYDEDGNFLDPKISKLTDEELMIPAEKARIMHSKALEEVRIKNRKKTFAKIHSAIKAGKTQVRLEAYNANAEILTYLDSLGYRVETITPEGTGFAPMRFDDDGEPLATPEPYRFYIVRWGDPAVVESPPATSNTTLAEIMPIMSADTVGFNL